MQQGSQSLDISFFYHGVEGAKTLRGRKGMGVYKARVLQAYYSPLQDYNDYVLCNAANKGGAGLFDEIMKFLDGVGDTSVIPAPSIDRMQNKMEVFPNPTMGYVQFRFLDESNRSVACKITDVIGRVVYRGQNPHGSKAFEVDLSALPAGLYFYHVDIGSESFFGKIEKQ